jgi:hypothetical protein
MRLKLFRDCALGFLALVFASPAVPLASAGEESGQLKIVQHVGDEEHVEINLQAGGTISLKSKGETQTHPMSVVAEQTYDQRILPATQSASVRAIRHYSKANAAIKIEEGGQTPKLAENHRTVIAERHEAKGLLLPAEGNFNREELDLLDIIGNPLLLDIFLPEKKVNLGDEWKLADDDLSGVLSLDRVTDNSLICKLDKIENGHTQIALSGTVEGAVAGAKTVLEIKARCHLDEARQAVTWFAIVIKERRSIGPVGPGLDVTAKLTMRISPTQSTELAAIDSAVFKPKKGQELLEYTAPRGEFSLLHDRQWYVTSAGEDLTVFRMVGKQELVAQCNASAIRPTSPESPTSLEAFQKDVQQTLGKNFGQFVKAQQGMEGNRRVLRVEAEGSVQEMPIDWVYYLLTDLEGRQVSLAFTYERTLAEQFAAADQQIVKSITIHAQEPRTARRLTK